jgi:hypothetical protein
MTGSAFTLLYRLTELFLRQVLPRKGLKRDGVSVTPTAHRFRRTPQKLFMPRRVGIVTGGAAVVAQHGPVDASFPGFHVDPALVALAAQFDSLGLYRRGLSRTRRVVAGRTFVLHHGGVGGFVEDPPTAGAVGAVAFAATGLLDGIIQVLLFEFGRIRAMAVAAKRWRIGFQQKVDRFGCMGAVAAQAPPLRCDRLMLESGAFGRLIDVTMAFETKLIPLFDENRGKLGAVGIMALLAISFNDAAVCTVTVFGQDRRVALDA